MMIKVSNVEHTDVNRCLSRNGAFIVQRTVTALNINKYREMKNGTNE